MIGFATRCSKGAVHASIAHTSNISQLPEKNSSTTHKRAIPVSVVGICILLCVFVVAGFDVWGSFEVDEGLKPSMQLVTL